MNTCTARGCPCLGTLKGLCRYHLDATDHKDWPWVTEQIKKNVRLLTAIQWAMTEGQYMDNERCRAALTRLSEEYPELVPLQTESGKVWAYRAMSWLSKAVRPVRYSDMANRLRLSADRTKWNVREL